MTETKTTSSIPIPKSWPAVVSENYIPLQILGVGSFASVVLAAKKKRHGSKEGISNDKNDDDKEGGGQQQQELVAIKIVGGGHDNIGYAKREITILKQISHPNIVKIVDYYYSHQKQSTTAIALSYHIGPTLETILLYGGAVTIKFGRTVISQIIDAISYLHSHAIIHRDIKPNNIIVSGAYATGIHNQDNQIWCTNTDDNDDEIEVDDAAVDDSDEEEIEDDVNDEAAISSTLWDELRKKWHVTVVDFGFARALTSDDMINNVNKSDDRLRLLSGSVAARRAPPTTTTSKSSATRNNSNKTFFMNINKEDEDDNTHTTTMDDDDYDVNISDDNDDDNISISRQFKRRMSSLGTKEFCAPEITKLMIKNTTRRQATSNNNTAAGDSDIDDDDDNNNSIRSIDITQNLHPIVSEYGIMADAYSLGQTFKHMMTGVVPGYTGQYDDSNPKKATTTTTTTRAGSSSSNTNKSRKGGGGTIGRWAMKTKKKLVSSYSSSNRQKKKIDAATSTHQRQQQQQQHYSSKFPQPPPRKVKHMRLHEIQDQEAIRLIQDLTKPNEDERLSVRGARRRKWISDVLLIPSVSVSSCEKQQQQQCTIRSSSRNNNKIEFIEV